MDNQELVDSLGGRQATESLWQRFMRETDAVVEGLESSNNCTDIFEVAILRLLDLQFTPEKCHYSNEPYDDTVFIFYMSGGGQDHKDFLAAFMSKYPEVGIVDTKRLTVEVVNREEVYLLDYEIKIEPFLEQIVPYLRREAETLVANDNAYKVAADDPNNYTKNMRFVLEGAQSDMQEYYNDEQVHLLIKHFLKQADLDAYSTFLYGSKKVGRKLAYLPPVDAQRITYYFDKASQPDEVKDKGEQYDLFDDIHEFGDFEAGLDIFFVYNLGGRHWALCQICIDKTDSGLSMCLLMHDPFHKTVTMTGEMEQKIVAAISKNIKRCLPEDWRLRLGEADLQIHIAETVPPELSLGSRQPADNGIICGLVAVEDAIAFMRGEPRHQGLYTDDELKDVYAKHKAALGTVVIPRQYQKRPEGGFESTAQAAQAASASGSAASAAVEDGGSGACGVSGGVDFDSMTEEEQLEYAVRLSMEQGGALGMKPS